MHLSRRALLATAAVATLPLSRPAKAEITTAIDWPAFLGRHDLVWQRLPEHWGEAPFLGNGRLALAMTLASDGSLRFAIDNADYYDRRDDSWGWAAYSRSRYPVGAFHLILAGKVTGCDLRLNLHDAELSGTVTTDTGVITLTAVVAAEDDIVLIDIQPTAGEQACTWEWRPAEAVSGRPPVRAPADLATYVKTYGHDVKTWVDNPAGQRHDSDNLNRYVQPLLAGGGNATVWRQDNHNLVISNAMSFPDSGALDTATARVKNATSDLRARHHAWWHAYYPLSFVTFPDPQLESFYWIQMYKYACITRANTGIIDTHGPWLQPTGWPYITWNLNSQISYWALQPANRAQLGEGLFHALDSHADTLRANAGPDAPPDSAALGHCSQQDLDARLDADMRYAREWGNLLWVCHNYWLQYRFTMDDALLRDRLFPLLRRAVNFYLPKLTVDATGTLHLPVTYSPEAGETADCNYDLALLKWACDALTTAAVRLHIADPLLPRWQDVTGHLVPYPADADGYRLGADLPAEAHRHFSHLLMIYPLYSENRYDPAALPLITQSVDHWLTSAISQNQAAGFTYAVGASFEAALGRGDKALETLQGLFARTNGIGKIFPNTMYAEKGQNIETPLAAAQGINDMLIQSWGGVIRVFPAMPAAWPDAAFHDLRAEGAFLVSAVRRDGQTQWLRVKSLAGEPCIVDWQGERRRLDLKAGEETVLALNGVTGPFEVAPVPRPRDQANPFGLRV